MNGVAISASIVPSGFVSVHDQLIAVHLDARDVPGLPL